MPVHLASGGGAWVQCTEIWINVGGVWEQVEGIAVNVLGEWKTAFGTITDPVDNLQATIDRTLCLGSRTGAGEQYTQWATVTVTPGGNGVAPYTYAWTHVSGAVFDILEPTANSTAWHTTLAAGETKEGVYRCTVTDSDSPAKTVTFDVTVRMWSTGGSGLTVDISSDGGVYYPEYGVIQTVFTAAVSGGNGSYSYTWSGSHFTPQKSGTLGANQAYHNGGGSGVAVTVTCQVTDTAGNSGQITENFTVYV